MRFYRELDAGKACAPSLDPDVARQLKARVAQQKRSVNRIVNEAFY